MRDERARPNPAWARLPRQDSGEQGDPESFSCQAQCAPQALAGGLDCAPVAGRVYSERDAVDARIAWLVFDHSERRNAVTLEMWQRIPELAAELDADPEVRVVVLRGAGERAFVAGADISQFGAARTGGAADDYDRLNVRAFESLDAIGKPVIAMLHGFCVGGGVALALQADVRYSSSEAIFSVPAARLGLGYQLSGLDTLSRLVGPSRALEIFFTARRFSAEEAHGFGLLNGIFPATSLEDRVREIASGMADNAPLTLASVKRIVRELGRPASQRDLEGVEASIRRCFESEDYREGVQAFMEKRPPRFQGR